jgi:hypothetical protein
MNLLNVLKAAAIVGLAFGAAACHQGRQPLESAQAAARADGESVESAQNRATDAGVVRTRVDAYVGEIFARELKELGSKPPDEDAPSF